MRRGLGSLPVRSNQCVYNACRACHAFKKATAKRGESPRITAANLKRTIAATIATSMLHVACT